MQMMKHHAHHGTESTDIETNLEWFLTEKINGCVAFSVKHSMSSVAWGRNRPGIN